MTGTNIVRVNYKGATQALTDLAGQTQLMFAVAIHLKSKHHSLTIYPGVPHAFVMMNRLYAGAETALDDAARAAREFIGRGER
jgi:hypothetical protein